MSWEETSRIDHKCPCGQSTYTVVSLSDDWNRHEERWEMNCPNCKKNYELLQQEVFRSGFYEEVNLWVPAIPCRDVEILKKQLYAAKHEVTQIALSRYLDRWLDFFEGIKTKKNIWQILTHNGQKQPSLATFYNHIKNTSKEDYLKQWFDYNNIPEILQELEVIDEDLNQQVQRTRELADELKNAETRLRQMGFRSSPLMEIK